jgi:hypothetical protein
MVVLQAVAQMESGRRKLMVTLARALEGSNRACRQVSGYCKRTKCCFATRVHCWGPTRNADR